MIWQKSQATLPVSPEIRPLRALLQAAAACCLFICAACGMAEADEPALPPRIALITPAGAGELAEAISLGAEAAAKERGAQLITVEAYPVDNPSHTSSNADFTIGPPFANTAAAAERDLTRSEREQAQVQALPWRWSRGCGHTGRSAERTGSWRYCSGGRAVWHGWRDRAGHCVKR